MEAVGSFIGTAWQLTLGPRWPWSVRLLVVVGFLFLLQAFPYTGIFLMIVGAALWSIPLINLAVVVAGIEGLAGWAPRWFMLVPLVWFGGYAAAHLAERAALSDAQAKITAHNEATRPLVYDRTRQSILTNDRHLTQTLLETGRADTVYLQRERGRDREVRAVRLATGSLCDELKDRKGGVSLRVERGSASRARGIDDGKRICFVWIPEQPVGEVLHLRKTTASEQIGTLPVSTTTLSATTESVESNIRSARAAILQPWPMPVVGCGLNSGAPSWDCFAFFMRQSAVTTGPLAQSLKTLERVIATSANRAVLREDAKLNAVIRRQIVLADARVLDARDAVLRAFLSDPLAAEPNVRLFKQYKNDSARLVPFADELLSVLEAAHGAARDRSDVVEKRARVVAPLVALLPDATIRDNGLRILRALDGPVRGWRRYARALMRRTVLLGDAAMPMLRSRLDTHRAGKRLARSTVDAMIALCRLGTLTAAPAGPRLLEIWRDRLTPKRRARRKVESAPADGPGQPHLTREDHYLYAALLRLGLRDEAGRVEPVGDSPWWRRAWETITPQSPPDFCEAVR